MTKQLRCVFLALLLLPLAYAQQSGGTGALRKMRGARKVSSS